MSQNYFSLNEFKCRCGCGKGPINPQLIKNLNDFREYLGKPILVTSGFRCKSHNGKVGGATNSYHLVGSAADIHVKGLTGPQLYLKLVHWDPIMFGGVGIGANFIHVDVRNYPALFFYDGITLSQLHPDQVITEE